MRRILRFLFLLIISPICLLAGGTKDYAKYLQGETAFTENKGQLRDMDGKPVNNVLAYYTTPGLNLYITTTGVTYMMQQFTQDANAKPDPVYVNKKKSTINYSRVDVDMVGAQISTNQLVFTDAVQWKSNYYKNGDGNGQLNVVHYKMLTIKNVYPGIDWVWKCEGNSKLECSFIVHPGANASTINMNYRYADITPSANKIRIAAKYGTLAEGPLQANSLGNKVDIEYTFNKNANTIKFNVGTYNHSEDLVIDPPLALEWSALYGGSFNNGLQGVTTDTAGYIYLVGYTNSPDFPVHNAGGTSYFDGHFSGGNDAIILKIDTLQTLLWSVFMGGPGNDEANSVAIDKRGNVFVTGTAESGFPLQTFPGAYYQATATGQDAFICAFNDSLALKWSTFYGGNGDDEALKIYADTYNNIYIAGYTNSTGGTFPTVAPFGGAYQQPPSGGYDAFILEFSSSWGLYWGTLYGGWGDDYATSLTTDSSDNLVVSGFTTSGNLPLVNSGLGYYQPANGGGTDGFILKFYAFVYVLWHATYYGGSGNDYLTDVATESASSIAFTGWTTSSNFHTQQAGLAYYQSALAGASDAVIVQLNQNLQLNWATYYGGANTDVGTALACDKSGRIYLTGFTFSTNFPLDSPHYAGSYYQPTNGGLSDGFLAGFSSLGVRFWSTYKGDSCYEYPNDIAYNNKFNKFYVVGQDLLDCEGLPDSNQVNGGGTSTIGFCWGFDNTGVSGGGSGGNGGPPGCFDANISGVTIPCPGQCNGKGIANYSGGTAPYTILWSDNENTDTAIYLCAGQQWVEVEDAAGCVGQAQVNLQALALTVFGYPIDCQGFGETDVTALFGTPPYNFMWSNGISGPSDVSITSPGYYIVSVTDAEGCTDTAGAYVGNADTGTNYSIQILQYPSCGQHNGILVAYYYGIPTAVTWDISSINGNYSYQVFADTIFAGFDSTYTIDGIYFCDGGYTYQVTEEFFDSINIDTIINIMQPLACGDSLGWIEVSMSQWGDNSDYFNYQWSNGSTFNYIDSLPPGSYSLAMSDEYGCSATFSFNLNLQDTGFSISTGSSPQVCASYGEAWVNINNGVAPLSVYWPGYGYGGDTLNGLHAAIYTVDVTDNNGCVLTDTVTVSSITDNITDDLMYENCDYNNPWVNWGTANVYPEGNYPPFNVQWSTGDTGWQVSNLASGNYSLTVTDAVGCSIIDNFTIALVQWQKLEWGPPPCTPGDSAILYYNISGASAVYFEFYLGSTSLYFNLDSEVSIPPVVDGVNDLEIVADDEYCSIDTIIEIPFPDGITDSIYDSYPGVACSNTSHTLSVMITQDYGAYYYGDPPNYTYQWNTGATTATVNNLQPGIYTCTVMSNGCTVVSTDTVTDTWDNITDNLMTQNCDSNGNPSGGGFASVSPQGIAPFNVQWSNGNSGFEDYSLANGNYSVTVTDSIGCSVTQNFTITITTWQEFSIYPSVMCNLTDTTTLTFYIPGNGAGWYNEWPYAGGLNYGNLYTYYSPTVLQFVAPKIIEISMQVGGCFFDSSVWISNPIGITDNIYNPYPGIGCADTSRTLSVMITQDFGEEYYGDPPNYTYQWNTGATTATVNNLTSGIYTCTVTSNGCVVVSSDTIAVYDTLSVSANIQYSGCSGADTGSIDLTVSGGTPGYSYKWSNDEYNFTDTLLTAGIYTCTVSDANNCSVLGSYAVYPSATDSLAIGLVTIKNETCYGDSSGVIQLSASGATGNYTYNWSNGRQSATDTGLIAGNYTCTITDSTGCLVKSTNTVIQPDSFYLIGAIEAIACYGETGGIIVTPYGGTPPYSFLWSSNNFGNPITAGTYMLTVTDVNGCAVKDTFVLTQPTQLVIIAYTQPSLTCYGADNGSIDLSVSGGTVPYSYRWNNFFTGNDLNSLYAGTYSYTVTDSNGCRVSDSIIITQPDSFAIAVNSTNTSCFDSANGSISLAVSGGAGNYTYRWSNNITDSTNALLPAGNYACTITDGSGCTITDSFTITQPDSLKALFTFQEPTCGAATGSITLDSAYGGTQPYTLHWNNGDTGTSISNISSGVYYLTITDNNGCVYTYSDSVPCITGIENITADDLLTVFPNPASTVLYINALQKQDYKLLLRDVTGQMVLQSYFTESAILNVADLARGIYLAEIFDRNNVLLGVKKVVLQ